jgi:hypothetical protein
MSRHKGGGCGFRPRMELGRTLAKQRRNRDLHTGKSAAGWSYQRPAAGRGSRAAALSEARAGWQSAVREACNDFAVAA